jgi:hypothetical protein
VDDRDYQKDGQKCAEAKKAEDVQEAHRRWNADLDDETCLKEQVGC